MKSYFFFTFATLLIMYLSFFPLFSFAQWAWQNPLPQGHELTTIKGIDELHCWAGGANGTIMSTRNGGDSWYLFHDNNRRWVRSIDFTDSLNGWAVGQWGFRFHTTDGGMTWTDRSTDTLDRLSSVSFVDEMHGWICNENASGLTNSRIIKTMDGGNTWTPCPAPAYASPSRIKFNDLNHGWFSEVNGTDLYSTSDGGNTWIKKMVGGNYVDDILDFYFADQMHGCVVTYYMNVMYTSDGGDHWDSLTSPDMSEMAVTMDGPEIIYVAGDHFDYPANPSCHVKVSKSTDAGLTWTSYDFDEPELIHSISLGAFIQNDFPVLWIAGQGGSVFRSVDENISWQAMTQHASLAGISSIFFDKTFPVGWAATRNGYVLKTSNGGANWHKVTTGITTPLTSVWFLDTLTGFVAGDKGILLRTSDGGSTWTQAMTVVPGYNYVGLCFTDQLNGWTISSTGAVYHTVDGGNTWTWISMTNTGEIFAFTFPDSKHGWVVGQWGTIKETHDGGKSWHPQISHVDITQIWDVSFTDSLYGWCAVGRGYKIHTTDGGKNWLVDGSIYVDAWDHYAVKFFDHFTGYMTGQYYWDSDGFILKTTDGGITWNEEQISIGNTINKLFAYDTLAIYGAGRSGTIIKYTGGILQQVPVYPDAIAVTCNPNPFSEVTFVKIRLTGLQPVSIQVYDSRGRMVLMITEKVYPAGDHSIQVNMKNFPDGTYFFRIKTPGTISSGKMIKWSGNQIQK